MEPNDDCLPFLKALSDETRWKIVETLIALPEPIPLGELASRIGVSDYKASRHVSVLIEAGIITSEKVGRMKLLSVCENRRNEIARASSQRPVLDLGCCSFRFDGKNGMNGSNGDSA